MNGLALRIGRAALDLLLPPVCLTCDRPVDAPGRFCAACFARTAFITEPCCTACGHPFSYAGQGGPDGLCSACRTAPPPWVRARGALRYDAQTARLILGFKYADRPELAAALAPMMARAGAALLARALSRLARVPAALDLLRRVRRTAPLGDLGRAARAERLAGAIAAHPARAPLAVGRRVLLVDDVMTSGATAAACTEALLAAGARAVDVLVAARVADPRLA
jgi:predicted amidophosphoribosyltransferase